MIAGEKLPSSICCFTKVGGIATPRSIRFYTDMIRKKMRLNYRPRPLDVIQFMLDQHLQFEPGEKDSYSNFGYMVPGRVAEQVTKLDYYPALDKHLQTGWDHRHQTRQASRERTIRQRTDLSSAERFVRHRGNGLARWARRQRRALCQFLSKYWLTGVARVPGEEDHQISRYGSLMGTTAVVRQTNGWDVAILFNGRARRTSRQR